MNHFFRYILCFALIGLLGNVCADETPEGEYMREVLIRLADEGTEDAYREIERMLAVLTPDQPLFAGEYGYGEGKRSIDKALSIIGDHGNETSYQFLAELMRNNFEDSGALDSEMWTYILSNLLKYRESKSDELVELIEEGMLLNYEKSNRLREEHPFVDQEGIYYHFAKNDYVSATGEVIHPTSVNRGVRYDHLMDSLRVIGTKAAYSLMLDYFSQWFGRESSTLMDNTELHLKEKRYDPHVISLYEALFKDERHHPDTRNRIINAFFTNEPVFYSDYVHKPEEFYPQLDELDQERLVRILALADYALSQDFLSKETVDLIKSKRAEILELLSEMGYKHEVETEPEVAKEVTAPEPAIDETAEVATAEPSEELAEKSSNWWLWLIGAVVVVGGIGLIARRKS